MTPPDELNSPTLESLLLQEREALLRFLEREARGVLKFESAEDLAQEVHAQALIVRDHFEYRGPEAFLAWLFALAKQQCARRHEHWSALKRRARTVLRITAGASGTNAAQEPSTRRAGPRSLAETREKAERILAAIATLSPRDQDIVRRVAEGASDLDLARELAIGAEAAARARRRALDRLRRAYEILERAAGRRGSSQR